MLTFDVRGDIREITDHLSAIEKRHVPFATALALTRTAQFAGRKLSDEIGRVFDRPKDYTKNATYIQPATKQSLVARVKIKDQSFKSLPPIKWLISEITGGKRRQKAFELLMQRAGVMPAGMVAVPTRAVRLDANGNIPTSMINSILSDVRSRRDPLQNVTAASRRRRARSRTRAPVFYFSSYPRNAKTEHLPLGIYRRTQRGANFRGPVRQGIQPVLIFVSAARYRVRLRFNDVVDQTARMRFPIEFTLAMRYALATAR